LFGDLLSEELDDARFIIADFPNAKKCVDHSSPPLPYTLAVSVDLPTQEIVVIQLRDAVRVNYQQLKLSGGIHVTDSFS